MKLLPLLLSAAWTPALLAQPAPAPALPSFGETLEVNVVNVEAYVTDRDGRRVTGLRKDDFILLEDGKAVEVTNFSEARREPGAALPAVIRTTAALEGMPASGTAGEDPESALSLVVFVDNLHLHPQSRTRALEQVRKFLAENARGGDRAIRRIMVVTHDLSLRISLPFTDDLGALDAALHKVEELPSYGQQADSERQTAYQAMIHLYELEPCDKNMTKPIEGYADQLRAQALNTLGALRSTINSLSGIPGRKAILLISDGISITPGEELFEAAKEICEKSPTAGIDFSSSSRSAGSGARKHNTGVSPFAEGYDSEDLVMDAQNYSVTRPVEDLAAHASAQRVTFYTLQASGLQPSTMSPDVAGDRFQRLLQFSTLQQIQTSNLKGSLTAMAADTGGRAMLDVNDFLPELARMQEDFETYYSLGYTPAHTGDGKVHNVEVKVKRPGLRVRYRQSYRDKPVLEKMADRTLAALFHGIEDNPLGITVEIGDQAPAENGWYSVPVQLRIPLFKLAILNRQTTFQGKLRVLVATRDDHGGTSAVRQIAVPLNIPRKEVLSAMGQYYVYTLTLKMKRGDQHVAVAVRDDLAAATSYLSRPVTVGAAAVTR